MTIVIAESVRDCMNHILVNFLQKNSESSSVLLSRGQQVAQLLCWKTMEMTFEEIPVVDICDGVSSCMYETAKECPKNMLFREYTYTQIPDYYLYNSKHYASKTPLRRSRRLAKVLPLSGFWLLF